ncbi:MAG TPA: hypothetical protein VGP22_10360 [Albitalea sp.]|jgi:hypothetical protein|nr:hypothetical protein [Albitalea sp.]
MRSPLPISSDGYFTILKYLLGKPSQVLEDHLGFSKSALAGGWHLYSPKVPLSAVNIDLRGSTGLPDGRLPDGRWIADVISERADVMALRRKVSSFFDKGLDRRPCKVVRISQEAIGYPKADQGIPQFRLHTAVDWVWLATVAPGEVLERSTVRSALC